LESLFDSYNDLGYQEKYYQRAVSTRFKGINLSFKEQVSVKMIFQGNEIGKYFLDFIIEDKITLEIKKEDKFLKADIVNFMLI